MTAVSNHIKGHGVFTWERYGGYECSSKGDKRFSAFFATMPDGRSLECHYQLDNSCKAWNHGGSNWKLGKGRPPKVKMTNQELYDAYKALWAVWVAEHLELFAEVAEIVLDKHQGVFSDMFAKTNINQARALADLANEYFCGV